MSARCAIALLVLSGIAAGVARAGFGGGAGGPRMHAVGPGIGPDVASVFDATLNAFLAGPILATFSASGVSLSGPLAHEGVTCDTTALSADGFAHPESLAYTGAYYHSSRFLVTTPNCTTQVWVTKASGTALLRKDAWPDDFHEVAFSGFLGPEEIVSVYLKPALVPVNPPNPMVTIVFWRFARVVE